MEHDLALAEKEAAKIVKNMKEESDAAKRAELKKDLDKLDLQQIQLRGKLEGNIT